MKYKIVHTADWHLGKKFLGISCEEDEKAFLYYFLDFIKQLSIDAILVCGDIYDSINPPIYAEALYYDFLKKVSGAGIKTIVISGNHDSKNKLSMPKNLIDDQNAMYRIITSTESIEIFPEVCVHAVPFLTYGDANLDTKNKTLSDVEAEYRSFVNLTYSKLADNAKKNSINIATGHFSFDGFSMNQSMRFFSAIDKSAISYSDIFKNFDYIAMGHLHQVQAKRNIVYSGSPFVCNFGETENVPSVSILSIDTENRENKLSFSIEKIKKVRDVVHFVGSVEDVCGQVENYGTVHDNGCSNLQTYAKITLTDNVNSTICGNIRTICEKNKINLLKLNFLNTYSPNEEFIAVHDNVQQSPEEIFSRIIENTKDSNYINHKEELLRHFSSMVKCMETEGSL